MGPSCFLSLQLAAAAEIDEEPVSKAKQSRSEKKARKVRVVDGPNLRAANSLPVDS